MSVFRKIISVGLIFRKIGKTSGRNSKCPAFIKTENPTSNDDLLFLLFYIWDNRNPKMVAHDYTYLLAHISTAAFWHNVQKTAGT